MSSLLGYRPPQFSEELAWLPSWFQQQHLQPLDEENDLGYEFINKCTREDVIIPLEDEGRYKSCHLFLSGEDISSATLHSSSTNVGGFRLYLSPDGTSQDLYSSGLGTFKAGNMGADYVALVQKTELTASQEVRGNQCTMDHDAQETSSRPLTSKHETLEHACLQFLEMNNDVKMENQDNVKNHNVSKISEAVDLSIAAAEALIIHDMVKSSSSTKSLPAAAILEVALRVKQARLEGPEDGSYRSDEDSDVDESISEFHESDMADAYEDVGLIVCGSDNLISSAADISQVKETPNSETHSLNVSLVDIFPEQEPTKNFHMDNQERKNLAVELLDFDGKRKLKYEPTSGLTTSSKAPNNDIGLRWSVVEKSNVPAASEGLYLPLENMTPPQKKAKEICAPQAEGSVNDERDDKLHLYGSVKFQSRWLGGWMRKKEMNASASIACNNNNLIPKLLVDETSYLSESANVAPDVNSHVQIRDEGSHMASQPSILFNGLHDGADEGVNVSPDTGIPSCLSITDPLCSVVPCSLSSAHTCPSRIHDSNYVEDTEECLRLTLEHCNDNLRRTSISIAGEQHTVLKIDGEASHSTIRRQLTSLRTYSMLLPQCSSFLEKDRNYGKPPTSPNNSRLLSTEKNSCARGVQENHETSNKTRQDEPETQVHIEKEVEPETRVHIEKSRYSALILNRRKRHRVSACKKIDHDSDRGKTLEKALIPKCEIALRNSNLQDYLKCGVARDPEIPARKRVRFAEAGTQPQQKTNVLKQSSSTECLATKAGKKINSSNGQQVKKPQSNFPCKNAKRSIFRNLEFLLTGFPGQKEREINNLIRKHGGTVLPGIPSLNLRGRRSSRLIGQQHLVVLCPHKLETTEFLYGCVVNAFILRVDWLTDSVKAGSALAPDKYMVISNHGGEGSLRKSFCRDKHNFIFDGVGVMLHGKHSFCTRLAIVIKHGGGKVFKALQLMVQNLDAKKISSGIIVAEDERNVSRHLKRCALEGKIHTMTASWIINSLHFGKLLPFAATVHSSCLPTIKILDFPDSAAFSEEI